MATREMEGEIVSVMIPTFSLETREPMLNFVEPLWAIGRRREWLDHIWFSPEARRRGLESSALADGRASAAFPRSTPQPAGRHDR